MKNGRGKIGDAPTITTLCPMTNAEIKPAGGNPSPKAYAWKL